MEREGALLARYSPERDTVEFAQSGANRSLVYEPHYEGSSVVAGPTEGRSSAHGEFSFKARPGHHVSPQPLSGGRYLAQELGPGFTLTAFEVGREAVRPVEDAARGLQVPMKVIEDSFAGGRQRYESRLVLVRPDQHVVWVGDSAPDDTAALLRKVTGRPV